MTDLEQTRQYLADVDKMRADFMRATGQRTPTADRVKGALVAYLGGRMLALDAMPSEELNGITAGLDRHSLRARRHHVADAVRRAVRGKIGRDGIEDIDALLDHLCEMEDREEGEDRHYDARHRGEDRHRHYGRDDEPVERPGFEPALDPADHPFEAHDFLDEELESMRGELGEDRYRRLRRASDRRHRDAEDRRRREADDRRGRSPAEDFGYGLRGRDSGPPEFPGMPRAGGSMAPMSSSVDRPGMSQPRDVGAKDRGFTRPRRFGQDAAPNSFADRFSFTRNATTGRPSMPAIRMMVT